MAKPKNRNKARKPVSARETPETLEGRALVDAMYTRFEPYIPADERVAVRERLGISPAPALRVNPEKSAFGTIDDWARRYEWTTERVPFCADGYRLTGLRVTPGNTAEHGVGAYYIQDSASMVPVSLVDPTVFDGTPLILDMAASPGGKTTHLVSASGDRGLIIANDAGLSRIPALRKVLKNYGARNQLITNFSGDFFGGWFANRFDFVLLDAPCSMQSLVSIDSHPMRPISEREEAQLAQRQTQLLFSGLSALKPGGQLVYSTCTLSPNEDEAVVDAALKRFGSSVDVVDVRDRLTIPAPGITSFDGVALDERVGQSVRLWPNRYDTAGFFAVLLTKTDVFSEVDVKVDRATRPFAKSGYSLIDDKEAAETLREVSDLYGFNLVEELQRRGLLPALRGNELWAVPERVISEFGDLPAKSIGMRVAFESSYGWVPDFDWTTLYWGKIVNGEGIKRISIREDDVSRWRSGQEIPWDDETSSKGQTVYLTDECGVVVGCGVVSGNRLRNLRG